MTLQRFILVAIVLLYAVRWLIGKWSDKEHARQQRLYTHIMRASAPRASGFGSRRVG